MNVENINKTIAYLETRDWHSNEWDDETQCFAGIVGVALGQSLRGYANGMELLRDTLGIGINEAANLYLMTGNGLPAWHNHDYVRGLSTPEQNAYLIKVLETLRDEGEARWPAVKTAATQTQ